MSGVVVSGSLLSSFVIDRDGALETLTPANAADDEKPSPFSVELHFVSAEAAEAVGASAFQVASAMRALAANPDGAPA